MADYHAARRQALLDALPADVDGAAITPGPAFRYLTGVSFPTTERPVVLVLSPDERPVVVSSATYVDLFRTELGDEVDYEVYGTHSGSAETASDAFGKVRSAYGITDGVAFSYRATRLYDFVRAASEFSLDDIEDVDETVDGLRSRKDSRERETMRDAAGMAVSVLDDVISRVEPGMTEHDVDRLLRTGIVEIGAEAESLRTVASGERAADPIGQPSDREIGPGDPLVLDIGLVHDGYEADMTRTVAVGGTPDPVLREIHDVVRRAAEAARETVRPGVSCAEVDKAAREIVEDAGYGGEFPHNVGHGLGLEPHEEPFLAADNEAPLRPGHVCTVEPGIYVDGWGGVRIEDELLVTEDGAELLTPLSRTLTCQQGE